MEDKKTLVEGKGKSLVTAWGGSRLRLVVGEAVGYVNVEGPKRNRRCCTTRSCQPFLGLCDGTCNC